MDQPEPTPKTEAHVVGEPSHGQGGRLMVGMFPGRGEHFCKSVLGKAGVGILGDPKGDTGVSMGDSGNGFHTARGKFLAIGSGLELLKTQ